MMDVDQQGAAEGIATGKGFPAKGFGSLNGKGIEDWETTTSTSSPAGNIPLGLLKVKEKEIAAASNSANGCSIPLGLLALANKKSANKDLLVSTEQNQIERVPSIQ